MPAFELQGHRGARGLKPENTLPSFEAALDAGVTSIETDVHLTRDGVAVLFHDEAISKRLCRLRRGRPSPDPATEPLVSRLTLAELRDYLADRNPDRNRFSTQRRTSTPSTRRFSLQNALHAYTPPTLEELFRFALNHGPPGDRVIFDLELKRVPFHPEIIGDLFDGQAPGLLEQRVVDAVRAARVEGRTRVRSFDHRCVRAVKQMAPELGSAILIAETAPVDPAALAKSASSDLYCPDYRFLDLPQIRQCHAAGVRVIPWTVNEEADWLRLLEWGVDGITTDYPDRLADLLRSRGVEF